MKKSVKVILILVILLLLAVFLYSGYNLAKTYYQYHEADTYYEKQVAEKYVTQAAAPEETEAELPTAPGGRLEDFETIGERSPRSVDFDSLCAEYPDVRAWIYSPNTVIDYPVAQAADNDYYIERLLNGKWNPSGTLFLDYRCNGDFSGRNNIIYGHHMQGGGMLAALDSYRKQAYYEEHPVMYLNTPDMDYRLEAYAGVVTLWDSNVYDLQFISEEDFLSWAASIKSKSTFVSPIELEEGDRLCSLSTCVYDFEHARYVLLLKMVPLSRPQDGG